MQHKVTYRRFHRIQHLDVFIILMLFAVVWIGWPENPLPAGGRAPAEQTLKISYVDMPDDSMGMLFYPGHFAFSTPIGFGSVEELSKPDPLWVIAPGVVPFFEPVPRMPSPLKKHNRTEGAVVLPGEFALSATSRTLFPESTRKTASLHPLFIFAPDENLSQRSFKAPLLKERLNGLPAGELQAFIHLSEKGRVENVVFMPAELSWESLRPLEDALLQGEADPGAAKCAGWLRIGWQNFDAANAPPPPAEIN